MAETVPAADDKIKGRGQSAIPPGSETSPCTAQECSLLPRLPRPR